MTQNSQNAISSAAENTLDNDGALNENQEMTQLAEAQARIATLEDEFLRFRAESENQRRRIMKDGENARKFATEKLLQELLPVADTLLRGIEVARGEKATVETLIEGKEATLRMLGKALENNGVKEINPVGEVFNPDLHQAMTVQPGGEGVAPNTVIAVFQRGYLLNERLLRPALVVVSQS